MVIFIAGQIGGPHFYEANSLAGASSGTLMAFVKGAISLAL